jgi:polyvinyl alcohol dehydrogenase (cytochrome)
MRIICSSATAVILLTVLCGTASAQATDGAAVFKQACATCHTASPADARTPSESALRALTPEAILTALTTGPMRIQGANLSDAERRALAAFLGQTSSASSNGTANACTTVPLVLDPEGGAVWNGWGGNVRNTRFQPLPRARLASADVPRLTLKWAFGFADARSARSQPTIVANRLLVSGDNGEVYSLDPRSGCAHWTFRPKAPVRAAITVGQYSGDGATSPFAAYFGDTAGNVYAIDLVSGKELWTRRVDDHPSAAITAAVTLHAGRLYVGVSGIGEEIQASNLKYTCCTFRGSVVALQTATGNQLWKTYTIDAPQPRGKNSAGTPRLGPAGGGVWNAPTIDAQRGALYVGTGNGYSDPPQPYTSAVLALDLATGAVRWAFQGTKDDVWILGCPAQTANNNCPQRTGPDFDFGSSPILATIPGGRELIIAGQKSGIAYALDPDRQGALVWQYRAGKGAMSGGIQWGSAVDAEHVYFAVSDAAVGPAEAGGLHAVRLATGQRAWYTPPPTPACGALGPQCHGAQSAAITVIPGVVFSGSNDGVMRAFASDTGRVIWEFNTNREFKTVNGVKAAGGSIDAAGPVIVNGMLYFNSGYFLGRPGNVLLAFAVE